MITIKNVRNLLGVIETLVLPSQTEKTIDAEGNWTLFPAAIDVGVNAAGVFDNLAQKAINGGVTSVFYLSSFIQSISKDEVQSQKEKANAKLTINNVSLHSQSYFEFGPDTIESLGRFKHQMAGIIVPKGNNFDPKLLERIFQLAAQEDCTVVFVCDNNFIEKTHQALDLTEKYSTTLLLMDISEEREIDLLREAKKSELLVFSAASVSALQTNDFLWEAIYDKTLDLVASGFSKMESDLIFPTLLDGLNAKKVTPEGVVALTRTNAEKIFQLSYNSDIALVNLEKVKATPAGKQLKGWPCYTIVKGHAFALDFVDTI